jgi:hypothetical protein
MFPIRSRTEVVAAVALILVAGIITSDGAPPAGFAAHRNGKPRVRNKIILPLLLRSGSLAQISDLAVALLPGMCQEVKGGNLGGGLSCANPLRWCSTLASRSLLPVADPRPGLPGQQPPGSWILHVKHCSLASNPPLINSLKSNPSLFSPPFASSWIRPCLPRFYIAVRHPAAMLHQAFQDLHHHRVVRRRHRPPRVSIEPIFYTLASSSIQILPRRRCPPWKVHGPSLTYAISEALPFQRIARRSTVTCLTAATETSPQTCAEARVLLSPSGDTYRIR